ncbi:MAG TPA: hypothetical protein VGB76_04005, partial [Pyrinomonadaceae bacterium]
FNVRRLRTPFFFHLCLLIASVAAVNASARAQDAAEENAADPAVRTQVAINEVKSGDPLMANPLTITVNGMTKALEDRKITAGDLILTLNGHPLNGLKGSQLNENTLEFRPKRTDETKDTWNELLGSPKFREAARQMTVGLQTPKGEEFATPLVASFHIFSPFWANISLIGLLLMFGIFFWLAKTTNIIRDSNPPDPPPGKRRPYSLARTQAAFWFFLVIASFLLIYLITNDYNTITEQALILIGIGTGTALGAAMIDASKRDTSNDELAALVPERDKLQTEVAELENQQTELANRIRAAGEAATDEDKQALSALKIGLSEKRAMLAAAEKKVADAKSGLSTPVSEGLKKDLLSDPDGEISFHRFQIVVLTIILGTMFCVGVYRALAMPQFDGTLLALMGISSGTYLGFKIPERQS